MLKEIKNKSNDNNPQKREYAATHGLVFDKHASNKQSKRMDFAQIAVDVATFAYKNRCCSKNCILELVKQFTTDKVAEAVHLARKNVYTRTPIMHIQSFVIFYSLDQMELMKYVHTSSI